MRANKYAHSRMQSFPEGWEEAAAEREERRAALRDRFRTCPRLDKFAYLSLHDAERTRLSFQRSKRESLHSYVCVCGLYHHASNRPESEKDA